MRSTKPKPRKPPQSSDSSPYAGTVRADAAEAGTKPFSGQDWLFEPKWDGWRALCFVREGKVQFVSRKRNSLTERFPQLKQVGKTIKATSAILDGEVVAIDEKICLVSTRCGRVVQILRLSFRRSIYYTSTVMT